MKVNFTCYCCCNRRCLSNCRMC